MATLEQLPADRRAIIELVLQRGQSYADLADALGMPEARVRRYAREALASLSPQDAERVESEWLGQIADYLLRQQEGPQAKATRAHIKRSEPARAWAMTMLDSLGDLYPAGATPAVPGDEISASAVRERAVSGDGDGAEAAGRERRPKAEEPEPGRDEPPRERRSDRSATRERRPRGAAAAGAGGTAAAKPAPRRPLSSDAAASVRRRRILAGLGALVALGVILGILLLTGVIGGGGDEAPAGDAATDPLAQEPPELVGQVRLEPVGGATGAGTAAIGTQQGQPFVVVQARVEPTRRSEAYVVWLYNDQQDAVPIGAIQTDRQGNLQGAGPLPPDYEQYQSIDISLQDRDGSAEHSGNSVLRGAIDELEPAPAPEEPAPPPE